MTATDDTILLPVPGLLYGVYLSLDAGGNVSDQFEHGNLRRAGNNDPGRPLAYSESRRSDHRVIDRL